MSARHDAGAALRSSAAWLASDHVALVEVRGPFAFAALDRALPSDVFLHDGQARASLLLDDDASVVADVLVVRSDDRYLLLVDGLAAEDVIARIREAARVSTGGDVDVRDGRDALGLVSLHGPFAWELGQAWTGRRVSGLPPLGVLQTPTGLVVRGGKTGEYGYEILVPREALAAATERLVDVGARFDLGALTPEVLDAAIVESGGYAHRLVGPGLSPVELQLQWRLARAKDNHHAKAALGRRTAAATQRIAWFHAIGSIPSGSRVIDAAALAGHDGEDVGEVRAVVEGTGTGRRHVGLALLDRRVSHPGFEFRARSARGDPATLTTASPPLVTPVSVRVRPDVDTYARRAEVLESSLR